MKGRSPSGTERPQGKFIREVDHRGKLEQARTQKRGIGGYAFPGKKRPYVYAVESMQQKFVEPACSTVLAFTRLHPLIYFSPILGDQVNYLKWS